MGRKEQPGKKKNYIINSTCMMKKKIHVKTTQIQHNKEIPNTKSQKSKIGYRKQA